MAHRPAGGIEGKNVRNVRAPKVEPTARGANPASVSQFGEALAHKADPLFTRGYNPPHGPTDNVAAVGVGGGRTVMRSGSQATHGEVARREGPAPPVRDTLAEFGPDVPGRR
jgi:hypothetical protein